MSVPTPPVSLPRGPGQRRTAPIPPFSGAETPPPLPGVRCRPAAGRGRRSAAGRGGSGSRCPEARNGREHKLQKAAKLVGRCERRQTPAPPPLWLGARGGGEDRTAAAAAVAPRVLLPSMPPRRWAGRRELAR